MPKIDKCYIKNNNMGNKVNICDYCRFRNNDADFCSQRQEEIEECYEPIYEESNWIGIDTPPQYYKPVLCYSNNKMAVCWRANNDTNFDIYTIVDTDNIFENVSHWCELPQSPHFQAYPIGYKNN